MSAGSAARRATPESSAMPLIAPADEPTIRSKASRIPSRSKAPTMPADTTPRMPAHAPTLRSRQVVRRARWLSRRSSARMIHTVVCPQARRVRMTVALTAAA